MKASHYTEPVLANLELRHVRYFTSVASAGSISRAAEALRLAQPALSNQIKALEQQVGTALFDRTHQGTRLTPAGAAFHRSATKLIDRVERFVTMASSVERGELGALRIAVGQLPLLSARVGLTVATIRREYPNVVVDLLEIPAPEQYRALRAGEVDIAITPTPPDDEPGIESRTFYDDPIDSAALASSHRLVASDELTLQQLRGERLLLPAIAMIPHVMLPIVAALKRLGFREFEEFGTMASLAAHVAAGRGWTLATHSQRGRLPDGRTAVAVQGLHIPMTVAASVRPGESSALVHNALRIMDELRHSEWNAARTGKLRPHDESLSRPHRIPAALEMRHVKAFVALMNERNLPRAADALRLSHSALSQRIRALERAIGATLLQRSGRGVQPTAQALALQESAEEALRVYDDMIERVRGIERGLVGRCVFGVVPPALRQVMPTVLATLAEEYPHIDVHVDEVLTPFQPRELERGEMDVGIAHPLPGLRDDAAIDSAHILDDVIDSALLRTDHPLAGKAELTEEDLRDQPLLIPHPAFHRALHEMLMHGLTRIGLKPTIGGYHDTLRTMWNLAATGEGWMLGTHSQRMDPPPGLVAIPIEGLHIPWGFDLLWRRGETREEVLAVIRVVRGTVD